MQQSSAEVELDKLADLCSALRLQNPADKVAGCLLGPIASAVGAESAALRYLDLRQVRPRILNLKSVGVASSVSDDYLAHFHRFDPFLNRLTRDQDGVFSTSTFPRTGNDFQAYYRNFLQPNGLVHHAGFMLMDQTANQAWIFNFHRPAAAPEFADLEFARVRLIKACLQGQASSIAPAKSPVPETGVFVCLTSREHEVVEAVASGCANKEIAVRLEISPRTVENHLRNIYEKLHVNTRTQLLAIIHNPDYSPAGQIIE